MALTRITKGVIKPNENYDTHNINSTGIVTAIGLDVNGNGDISGNLSVGGVLTYEDVTSIDSVGIVTARDGIVSGGDIKVGSGVTIEGNGQATFVGVVTFGSGSTTIDNNVVNVGTALTLGHTQGLQFHTQNLHSAGFEINQINASGIITATTFKGSGDFVELDVDGHTNLDNVNISGVTTTTGDITIDGLHSGGSSRMLNIGSGNNILRIYENSSQAVQIYTQGNLVLTGATTEIRSKSGSNQLEASFHATNGVKLYHNNNEKLFVNGSGVNITGLTTITQDLDVDGHTNLDNVNIAGVTTSGNIHILSSGPRITFSDTNENPDFYIEVNASQFLIQDATNNAQRFRIQSNGIVDINGNTNFSGGIDVTGGPITATGDLDIDGHTNLDNVSIAGVTTFASNVHLGDNDKLIIGDHGDIQIYNDGSKSVIENGGSGLGGNNNSLHFYSQNDILTNSTYSQYFHCGATNKSSTSPRQLALIRNEGVKAYYNNNLKLETSPNGVDITGGLTVSGVTTTGNLIANHSNGQVYLQASDGSIELTRTAGGAYIDFKNSTSEDYDARINEEGGHLRVNTHFRLYDNKALELGNRTSSTYGDLRLYHDSSNSYIENHTGYMVISSENGSTYNDANNHYFRTADSSKYMAKFLLNGAVELYHDNDRVFFTETRGVRIGDATKIYENSTHNTAVIQNTDIHHSIILRGSSNAAGTTITAGNTTTFREYGSFVFRTGAINAQERFIIGADGTSRFVKGVEGGTDQDIAKFIPDGAVELYHNGNKRVETNADGLITYTSSGEGSIRIKGGEGGASALYLEADEADDNNDQYRLIATDNDAFYLQNYAGGGWETNIKANYNGSVELFHDNSQKKFETQSGGAKVTGTLTADGLTSSGGLTTTGGYLNLQGTTTTKILLQGVDGNQIRYRNAAGTYTANITSIGNGDTFRIQNEKQSQSLDIVSGGVNIGGRLTLPTTDTGITFGPGTAVNDRAHIEWKGGNNAGYLRISTDDDSDAEVYEHIEFGDYSIDNRQGVFTQHCRISRDQFLVKTGGGLGSSDRFKIDVGGVTHVLNSLNVAGITTSAQGLKFGTNSAHYLYESASDTVSLRITSDGPYAQFKDVSGELYMGSASGNLHLSAAGNSRVLLTNTNMQVAGDIYLSGELNLTNDGNKNRFIDCSMANNEALHIRSTQNGDAGHQNMALFHRNGGVNIYNAGTLKFQSAAHGLNVFGDIHLGGESNTATNQNRQIYWTGFDKEASGDNSDYAYIKHTTNVHGIAGSVLEIKAENDANDGIALAASNGNGIVAAVCKKFDVSGYIEPSPGGGDNGIKWQPDPYGGSGDIATMQYYQDGSGENTRLRILIGNDGDDDLFFESSGQIYAQGTFSAQTKNFRIPHVLPGLTTTTDLIHSSVESPQADNIYRGRTKLVAGISTVNIDTTNNMTDGTFVNLNRDVQCFTTNETGWTNVKGSVTGNLLTIIAQDNACTDTISWMVIGERWDLAMYNPLNPMTDENGKLRTEVPNRNYAKGYNEDYIRENKFRVGISTISRPSIENKEVE